MSALEDEPNGVPVRLGPVFDHSPAGNALTWWRSSDLLSCSGIALGRGCRLGGSWRRRGLGGGGGVPAGAGVGGGAGGFAVGVGRGDVGYDEK